MSYYGHASAAEPATTKSGGFHHDRQSGMDEAKIFVGGLSWQTTEETLRYHFEQYGEVKAVEVMRDRNTGDPRGFAFVVFKSDETVDLILKNKPHEINHKMVDVKRAQARGVAPPSIHPDKKEEDSNVKREDDGSGLSPEEMMNKVFIGGLPLHVDKEGLTDFFSCFGPVIDSIVMMDMVQNRSRGFGFVTFEQGSGGAQKAIESQPINMFGKMVEVKLATPKGGSGANPFQPQPHHRKPVMASSSTGEFAGLAASYGRAGWRAGYGSKAFGKAGWNVAGWDGGGDAPDKTGFSFSMLENANSDKQQQNDGPPPSKRARQ